MKKIIPKHPMDVFLRILIVSLLIFWCFLIARPFLVIIIWAVIISVAFYPIYGKVLKGFKGKRGLTVSFFILVVFLVLALPIIKATQSLVDTGREIQSLLETNEVTIPPPNDGVKEWPVIGDPIYGIWSEAAINLESFVQNHSDQITKFGGWLIKGVAEVFGDVALSLISLLVAGFFLYTADSSYSGSLRFAKRLIGTDGELYVTTARDTIRSVVQGILLIALIQSVLAYAGFYFMDIPAPALWALLVLMLAIIQLPVILVTIPMIIYAFSVADTTPAVIFAIYMMVVGLIDNVLKPLFLGRGLKVPMLIILIGSLGGMILHGIIGLFVGAVVLAIGYQTYILWLDMEKDESGSPAQTADSASE